MKPSPIKRHAALRPLSREHHDGLLLCWKIKRGLDKQIETARISRYIGHYYVHHLEPHFRSEEEHLFPLLGNEHPLVMQALSDHSRMRSQIGNLIGTREPRSVELNQFREQLEKHIRFEERDLFQELQNAASAEQLSAVEEAHHSTGIEESWADRFWQ